MRRAAVVLAALALAPAAHASTQLGIYGSIARFDQLTGQRSQVGHVIARWGNTNFDQIWPTLGPAPMLGFDNGLGAITMQALAHGAGDNYLLALSESARNLGKPVYIRPFGEMNGHWNAYCAYTAAGRAKGGSHSTAWFRKAFARVYLLAHGGTAAQVDVQLRRLGLPQVRTDLAVNPYPTLRVIWNPQGAGSPDVPGNAPQSYYPGDRYVDVVGDDLYDIGGRPQWAANERLYRAHPTKPYAFPEWGLWGIDDPAFIRAMAKFVRSHRRVELLSWFNGAAGGTFDIGTKPRSRAAYRALITPLG